MKSVQDYIVIFWFIPVLIQIILPLLYLLWYGFHNLVKGNAKGREAYSLDEVDLTLETA